VITQWFPSQLYGCLFCLVTSVSLLLLVAGWQGSSDILWEATGAMQGAVRLGFYFSWLLMFYGMSLNGFGYQTGLTPWWHWLRQTPVPPRAFQPRSLYRLLRHPVYLSFLGLIWFTPRMTLDHAVLTGLWTAYVFLGSYFKDERLAFYYGERYREYQARVPGYPFFPGVLGIRASLRTERNTPGPAEART
jgi:protein-S-isoprenylcysteine O-methyltransferase Ste14